MTLRRVIQELYAARSGCMSDLVDDQSEWEKGHATRRKSIVIWKFRSQVGTIEWLHRMNQPINREPFYVSGLIMIDPAHTFLAVEVGYIALPR